MAEGQK